MPMYDSVVNRILKIGEEEKKEDYWKERGEIPLFSKDPYDDYNGNLPEDEILTLKVDTRGAQQRNPFNALICASTGVGKTRFIKNLVKGFYKQGYRILFIEPKSFEMLNANKLGKGRRIAPKDFNESIPVVGYCPNYIKEIIAKNNPELMSKVKFYSPNLAKLDYPEIWQSFGMPPKVANMVVEKIKDGETNLDKIEKMLPKMHPSTERAVSTAFASLKATKYFDAKNFLPLEEEWNKGNIVNIMFQSRSGALMNTDIGLIIDLVRDIGIKESSGGLNKVTKKLIIFDDAFYYAGSNALAAVKVSGAINLAVVNIQNSQNNFRTWGVDTIFVAQSPDSNAIHPALIDGCTTKFVSYVENPEALRTKLPFNAFRLISNTDPRFPMLYNNEENYIFQWIYVQGKTRWVTGFPFDVTVGHT